MQQSRFDAMAEAVRNRGVFIPVTTSQDMATLVLATVLTAVTYFSLTTTRSTNIKDKVLLISGSAIFIYGGRYVMFGTRWGVASGIWLTSAFKPVTAANQWAPCPSQNATACHLPSIPRLQGMQQQPHGYSDRVHFAPVLHYIKSFVEQQPIVLMLHLLCVMIAGLLWPLQVWGTFRQENYGRHKKIGTVVMTSLLGSHLTAAVITYSHLTADAWAEKAIGCSFSVHIVASIYSLIAALAAAKRRDIPTHRRHVIRMLGLAYGIFPTKYIWVGVLAISNVVSGTWAYATAIALSAITGVVVTDWAFGEHISPKDMAYDRSKGTLDARHIKDA